MDGDSLRRLREYHGLSQLEVARAANLHQSDVSVAESGKRTSTHLLKRVFEGIARSTSPSRIVERRRDVMRAYLESNGVSDVRIFGSTARGQDRWDSDIDIIATLPPKASLFDLVEWESDLRRLAGGIKVELTADSPEVRAKLVDLDAEAIPL